jgi:2-iminobutanoate/2-iminopropanoate deaminase
MGEQDGRKQVVAVPERYRATSAVYSQVVRAGNLLFVSGQAGLDPDTGALAGSTVEAQARQAFRNLAGLLEAARSGLDQVVKITVFLVDPAGFGDVNRLWSEFFPVDPPARSTPVVALPVDGLLISIDATAVVADSET